MSEERGRDKFNRFKSVIIFISKILMYLPLKMRLGLFNLFRNASGVIGIGIRYILIRSLAKRCGDNVSIHKGTYILSPQNMKLGNNISIHPMCYLDATGGIEIGNDVSIAHSVTVMSTSHSYSDREVPIKDQMLEAKKTKINNNIWIGAKSMILAGIEISDGVVVGASSVVTKDVEKESIVVGNPARILKKR